MRNTDDNPSAVSKARSALVEAMDPNTKLDPVSRSYHLERCLSTYKHAMRDSNFEEVIKQKMAKHGIKNASQTWKSNLKNADISEAFESKENIARDCKLLENEFKRSDYSKSSEQNLQPSSSKLNKPTEVFRSALDAIEMQDLKKLDNIYNKPVPRKSLGMRRTTSSKFIPPLLPLKDEEEDGGGMKMHRQEIVEDEVVDERLKHIDKKMVQQIKAEIMNVTFELQWNDIAGLRPAKKSIQESVVWPLQRPDIFKGLRRPPKGILLYGPPGTGKTLIARCIASQSKSTFFNISASSLTSKWVGDGEKMVRALFAVARCNQPAVIFIDEIDSLLSARSDNEQESSRRMKTEFLVQLDGASTENEERLLIIGATNRPQELDQAARRRFVKRLYIPLPDCEGRLQLVKKLMEQESNSLHDDDFDDIAKMTEGFSGADMKTLCSDACLGPIRDINDTVQMETMDASEVRPVSMSDFRKSLASIRSSVSAEDLEAYTSWDRTYGTGV